MPARTLQPDMHLGGADDNTDALLRKIEHGHAGAANVLCERYSQPLGIVVRSMFGTLSRSVFDEKDVVQDVLAVACTRIRRGRMNRVFSAERLGRSLVKMPWHVF